jgi:uncharacterized protein YndB with AHSA1/START domain
MKWVLIILGVFAIIVAVIWAVGASLPKDHVASRKIRLKQSPETIWAAITNVDGFTSWRKDLKSIKRLPDENGKPRWVETMSTGDIPLRVEESTAPRRLVTRIADPNLPFGGTWTFEIEPAEGGATIRITEAGEVKPAFFRFMSRYVFGQTATLEAYLKSLAEKYGEQAALIE